MKTIFYVFLFSLTIFILNGCESSGEKADTDDFSQEFKGKIANIITGVGEILIQEIIIITDLAVVQDSRLVEAEDKMNY